MNRLAGKIALITGTAGGQVRAAASLFAAEGGLRDELDIVFLVSKHAWPHTWWPAAAAVCCWSDPPPASPAR